MRSRCSAVIFANSIFQTDLLPAIASSRFSNTLCSEKTVGFWNLRPMPTSAISGSVSVRRSTVWPNQAEP